MLYVYDNEVVVEPKIKGAPKEDISLIETHIFTYQLTIIVKTEMKRQS